MAFVNAYLTDEDKKFISSFEFHNPIGRINELARIPEKWSIDKENNYYLICLGGQGELDSEYPPNYYFERHIIRPFVRSYGDISIVTLSPGSIRILFILSFPLMWAIMMWSFCNVTLKVVLGNTSTTVPSTSIISDFDILYLAKILLFTIDVFLFNWNHITA